MNRGDWNWACDRMNEDLVVEATTPLGYVLRRRIYEGQHECASSHRGFRWEPCHINHGYSLDCWAVYPAEAFFDPNWPSTYGVKLLRDDWGSLTEGSDHGRVIYPENEWIKVPGEGAYVAVEDGIVSASYTYPAPKIAIFECKHAIGTNYGVGRFRWVRRIPASEAAEARKNLTKQLLTYAGTYLKDRRLTPDQYRFMAGAEPGKTLSERRVITTELHNLESQNELVGVQYGIRDDYIVILWLKFPEVWRGKRELVQSNGADSFSVDSWEYPDLKNSTIFTPGTMARDDAKVAQRQFTNVRAVAEQLDTALAALCRKCDEELELTKD